jgi:hypothetical protein
MKRPTAQIVLAVAVILAVVVPATLAAEKKSTFDRETVVYDEAKEGDFGPVAPDSKIAVHVRQPGVHVVVGTGTDAVDDVDAFCFEVTGDKPFDFGLVADAAEFKWLRAIEGDGSVRNVAFGSTNLGYRAPRNIIKDGLPPGKYCVEMFFGPDGAGGKWVVKIAPRDGTPRTEPLFKEAIELTTADKMKKVDWPGTISIFHGHNWGDDEKYVIAIREAGFGGAGSTEWQVDQCRKHGLRAFVFIWPHEAATIPAKHKDDKTVLCYYLSDRIEPHKWGSWAMLEKTAHEGDPYHPAIFTMRGLWGSIDKFCPYVRGRAMEYYHYHWDGNRHPEMHYALLDQFRRASAENGHVPICRIVETRPEDMRKTRQTVYTCLAYGVRGYRLGGRGIFDTQRRDERGVPTRTEFGEEIQRINAAIKAYSPIFKKARCQAVYHVSPLPPGCGSASEGSWVRLEGQEVLVGVFRVPAGTETEHADTAPSETAIDYLLVANRDAFHTRTATLHIRGKEVHVQRMDTTTAKWVDCPSEVKDNTTRVRMELEDGGGVLLSVRGHMP